ncbi:DUF5791 family protein [Halobium salinum]|uniref:DUF5791 family protein n=1 Tax=Halobium salinum TaxID=1364940 RepID=A0ABD5PD82_9EURY|nr:DUF5791 family protein [Halobium salinum]
MLYDAVDEPASLDAAALQAAYERELAAVVEAEGLDAVADETGVDRDRLAALDGERADSDTDVGQLTLSEAAAVLAVSDDYPDAEAIVMEVRDHLLLSMTTGVVDVDILAANLDHDLTGQEVQQAIEGRNPMTLAQLAAIQRFLAERNDR